MPADLSQLSNEELIAQLRAAQAREMGPKKSPLQDLASPDGPRRFFDKQAQDLGFKDSEDQVNGMSNRMALGMASAPVVQGLLSKIGLMGAGEAASGGAAAAGSRLNNLAGPIKNLPPPNAPLFEPSSAVEAPATAAGGGLLSKVGGLVKSKLGSVAGGVAGGQLAVEAGKKLWEKKGEIADKATTLAAGLLPEDTANKLKNVVTGANPSDLKNQTNDELIQAYREALARERGQKP